jgi:hypothetical protein
MGRLFPMIALVVFGAAAFLMAFFPRVLPSLTNAYYSLIKVQTRVSVEDYEAPGVRISGFVILIVEIVWLLYRTSIGKRL